MKTVSGLINGTGAALYVGIGFIPDKVHLENLEATVPISIEWSRNMRDLAQIGGISFINHADTQRNRLAFGAGVAIYRGGDMMTAASTAYLVRDDGDKRAEGDTGTIKKWTLDTAGNRTGHFDQEASTSYVGEGSRITIRETVSRLVKEVTILAMTSNGEADDEVTLSEAVKDGDIFAITNMYDYVGAAANKIVPAGFSIDTTGNLNSAGETIYFEASQYDL